MSVIFKPKALTQALSSANTDGVLCTMLVVVNAEENFKYILKFYHN